MKKILLLEEEKDTLTWLMGLLLELDEKVVVFARDNVADARRCAAKITIDLFVVDVTLDPEEEGSSPGLTFVDYVRNIQKYLFTPILFITALEDTMLYTYDKLNCYKLINKPVNGELFKKTAEDSLRSLVSIQSEKTFFFRKNGIIRRVEKSAVVFIKLIDHKLYIHTRDREELCAPYLTMKQLMDKLDSSDFVKCHRSTIVNMNYVKSIDTLNQTIQLKNGLGELGMGVTYVGYFEDLLRDEW